jgi:hypothetical protein
MTNIKKEIAKFFAGAMAWHALTHLALTFSDALPFTVLGITMTPGMNTAGIIVWSAVALFLAYYAWKDSAPAGSFTTR